MSELPENQSRHSFDEPDEDFGAPPEPEQIWPPPAPVPETPAKPAAKDRAASSFAQDPELAWEDETEKIGRAIDEIRNLDATGEADQVETESDEDFDVVDRVANGIETADDVELNDASALPAEASGSDFESMVAGTAPPIRRAPADTVRAPSDFHPSPRSMPGGRRRVPLGAEGEISRLWSNVYFSAEREAPRTVLVAAARSGDGATQVAASLAIVGAESDHETRIVLVDLNFRNPGIANVLQLKSSPGITDVLEGRASLESVIQEVPLNGGCRLHVLTTGRVPAQPLAMLKSRQLQSLIAQCARQFNHTIIDTASADSYPDAPVIGGFVDGALLVFRGGRTPKEVVADAKRRLDRAGVRCMGLVFNQQSNLIPDLFHRIA